MKAEWRQDTSNLSLSSYSFLIADYKGNMSITENLKCRLIKN